MRADTTTDIGFHFLASVIDSSGVAAYTAAELVPSLDRDTLFTPDEHAAFDAVSRHCRASGRNNLPSREALARGGIVLPRVAYSALHYLSPLHARAIRRLFEAALPEMEYLIDATTTAWATGRLSRLNQDLRDLSYSMERLDRELDRALIRDAAPVNPAPSIRERKPKARADVVERRSAFVRAQAEANADVDTDPEGEGKVQSLAKARQRRERDKLN